ncbi:hypothetical protein B0H13DRAFT_1851153 [Mycena leptocephala]|nr:hypothetical protein B0H13DRAFT_1851153 [Mycena leptocephala]
MAYYPHYYPYYTNGIGPNAALEMRIFGSGGRRHKQRISFPAGSLKHHAKYWRSLDASKTYSNGVTRWRESGELRAWTRAEPKLYRSMVHQKRLRDASGGDAVLVGQWGVELDVEGDVNVAHLSGLGRRISRRVRKKFDAADGSSQERENANTNFRAVLYSTKARVDGRVTLGCEQERDGFKGMDVGLEHPNSSRLTERGSQRRNIAEKPVHGKAVQEPKRMKTYRIEREEREAD